MVFDHGGGDAVEQPGQSAQGSALLSLSSADPAGRDRPFSRHDLTTTTTAPVRSSITTVPSTGTGGGGVHSSDTGGEPAARGAVPSTSSIWSGSASAASGRRCRRHAAVARIRRSDDLRHRDPRSRKSRALVITASHRSAGPGPGSTPARDEFAAMCGVDHLMRWAAAPSPRLACGHPRTGARRRSRHLTPFTLRRHGQQRRAGGRA